MLTMMPIQEKEKLVMTPLLYAYSPNSIQFNDYLDLSGIKPNENMYLSPPPPKSRTLHNSPQKIQAGSTTSSPVFRPKAARTYSEDNVFGSRDKAALTAFNHVLQTALDNYRGHDKVTNEELAIAILLVDDEQINLKVLQAILIRFGFTNIMTAKHGKEAVQLCKKHVYGLIFMDGEMPVMDGGDAIVLIRQHRHSLNNNTFIVINSTNEDKRLELKMAAGEHSTTIDKPYKQDNLIAEFKKLAINIEKRITKNVGNRL